MGRPSSFAKRVVDFALVAGMIVAFFYCVDLFAGKIFGVVRTVNYAVKSVWGFIASFL